MSEENSSNPETQDQPSSETKTESKVDFEALKTEAIQIATRQFNQQLEEVLGVKSLGELKEKQLKERGEFQKLAEQAKIDAQEWQSKYYDTLIRQAIAQACHEHNALDLEVVESLVKSRSSVSDKGEVRIGNQIVGDAIKALLDNKPYLVKPTGKAGSGSSTSSLTVDTLKEDYEKAVKSGDLVSMLTLKRKMSS